MAQPPLSAPLPGDENEPFHQVLSAIMVHVLDYPDEGPLNSVNIAGFQALLTEEAVEDNAPLRSLADAITRAVNEDGDGDWSTVNLTGVRAVVLSTVTRLGDHLECASDALKGDCEVVMAACNQNGMALEFASDALKADREVVMAACNQNGMALEFASDALGDDREVVLAACNQNGLALWYASDALIDDREVVMAACNQHGNALEFASDALKDDREVVMVAAAQNYQYTLKYSHKEYYTINHASVRLQAEFVGDRIVTHVHKQLRLRSSFFGPFLCAIALPAPEAAAAAAPGGARCLLPKLDIGEEKPIQHLIADFTGVPCGSSWRYVQLAAAHLAPFLAPPPAATESATSLSGQSSPQ